MTFALYSPRSFAVASAVLVSVACGPPGSRDNVTAPVPPARTPLKQRVGKSVATKSAPAPAQPCGANDSEPIRSLDDIDVIRPDERVPEFRVATTDCRPMGSDDLVGARPLVLVFFSSWCRVCDKKMPVVRRAAEDLREEATFLGVVLDEDDTWAAVPEFVRYHELDFPLVRGARFRSFALGYNPLQSVPVVVIVGRSGKLVDLQVGYSPFDYNRLVGAVEIAKRSQPTDSEAERPSTVSPNGL